MLTHATTLLPLHRTAQALEAENQSKHSYLAELQRVHEDERKKSRRYLHALEQDQEVSNLLHSALPLLWSDAMYLWYDFN
jgi:hypothetical protein